MKTVAKNEFVINKQINPEFANRDLSKMGDDENGREERESSASSSNSWEKAPAVVAKRNARERTRVHTVNQAFLVLKCHLPSLRANTKRVSKLRILRAALNYIHTLSDLVKSHDASVALSGTIYIPQIAAPPTNMAINKQVPSANETAFHPVYSGALMPPLGEYHNYAVAYPTGVNMPLHYPNGIHLGTSSTGTILSSQQQHINYNFAPP